jgi:hypothetical protein
MNPYKVKTAAIFTKAAFAFSGIILKQYSFHLSYYDQTNEE